MRRVRWLCVFGVLLFATPAYAEGTTDIAASADAVSASSHVPHVTIDRKVTKVSGVAITDEGASRSDATAVLIGIRRGLKNAIGYRFVDAVDASSSTKSTPEVAKAVAQLDSLAAMVREGDPNRAARSLENTLEVFEANLTAVHRNDLADAYMLLGLAQCQRARRRKCASYMRYVLTFRSQMKYDVGRYPPRYAAMWEQLRTSVATGATGTLEITTEPAAAEVFVDGTSYGASPVVVDGLLLGQHYVTIKAPGYHRAIRRVTVKRQYQTSTHVDLEPDELGPLSDSHLAALRAEIESSEKAVRAQALSQSLGADRLLICLVRAHSEEELDVTFYVVDATDGRARGQTVRIPSGPATAPRVRNVVEEIFSVTRPAVSRPTKRPSPPSSPHRESRTVFERWWFWAAVGVVVAGGAIAFGISQSGDSPPDGWIRVQGKVP